MNPVRFEGATHEFGKPKDWNEERDGICGTLPVFVDGNCYISVWQPSDEERTQIAKGANIVLSCVGVQLPVMLVVRDIQGDVVPIFE